MTPPHNPFGPFEPAAALDEARRREWIAQIEDAPAASAPRWPG
jgi:hypothetical protein